MPDHLSFVRTEKDEIAFALYAGTVVPELKRAKRTIHILFLVLGGIAGGIVMSIIAKILSVFSLSLPVRPLMVVVGIVVFAAIGWFACGRIFAWQTAQAVRRTRKSQATPAEDPCQLWLEDDGIHSTNRLGTMVIAYPSVTHIDETPACAYIFFTDTQALFVPTATPGFPAFMADLRQRVPQAPHLVTSK